MGGEPDRVKWIGVRPVEGIAGIWPSRNATRVNKFALADGVATAIVYTVPAGKKFYIFAGGLASKVSADAACRCYLGVRDDTDVFQYVISNQDYDLAGHQANGYQFSPALEAEAGWDVIVYGDNANISARAVIFGWQEDV